LIFLTPLLLRVPHPCVLCKGGSHGHRSLGLCAMNSRPCCTNLMVSAASCPPLRLRSGQALAETQERGTHRVCAVLKIKGWATRQLFHMQSHRPHHSLPLRTYSRSCPVLGQSKEPRLCRRIDGILAMVVKVCAGEASALVTIKASNRNLTLARRRLRSREHVR